MSTICSCGFKFLRLVFCHTLQKMCSDQVEAMEVTRRNILRFYWFVTTVCNLIFLIYLFS